MAKFLIKASRYIDGAYISASPEFPATIEVELNAEGKIPTPDGKGKKPDPQLLPLDTPKEKPHFAPRESDPKQTAQQLHSVPVVDQGKDKADVKPSGKHKE